MAVLCGCKATLEEEAVNMAVPQERASATAVSLLACRAKFKNKNKKLTDRDMES